VRLKDYTARLNTPGNMPDASRVWYDYRNAGLKMAVGKLKWLREIEMHLLHTVNPLAMFADSLWWLRVALVAAVGFLMSTRYGWLASVVLTLFLYFVSAGVALAIMRKRRIRHSHRLLRGRCGHAIMWDFEPAWEELNAALQLYGFGLADVITNDQLNQAVTPLFAQFLISTRIPRGVLRKHGYRIPPGSDALDKVRDAAHQAAQGVSITRARLSHRV